MSFLAPLYLLGGLAIALPILFHLIRQTPRQRVPFSSLMFLSPTPPRLTQKSRLQNLILLLLRCLALCLIAASFARPFLRKPVAALPLAGQTTQAIILLDSSASMRRSNLWQLAQAEVKQLLEKSSPMDGMALYTFDQSLHPVLTFDQWGKMSAELRIPSAQQTVSQLTPGFGSTQLGPALVQSADELRDLLLKSSTGANSSRGRIYLVSDLAEGSRLDGLQGFEWPRGIEVIVRPLKTRRANNAGLQRVREETSQSRTNQTIKIRVANASDSREENLRVGWVQSGETQLSDAVSIYVPPGQNRVVPLPLRNVEAHVQLAGDEETFDNSLFVLTPKVKQIDVLYLGSESETNSTQALFYLKRAFQQTGRESVNLFSRALTTPLSDRDLTNATLAIFSEALPAAQAQSLRSFIESGKTALVFMQDVASAQGIAQVLNLGSLPCQEASGTGYAILGSIDFDHPLFAPFADPRFSDFTKIHFWRHRQLSLDSIPSARALARFDNGDAAFFQVPLGRGALFVFTSSCHTTDSQLALSTKFVPLLYSLLEQSGNLKSEANEFLVGDAVPLPSNPAAGATEHSISKPDGTITTLPAGQKFTATALPGIYTVSSIQPAYRFAVNIDPLESKTAPLPADEFEKLGVPVKADAAEKKDLLPGQKEHLLATELENRQKLWRWGIVAALVVLVFETVLAGRLS